MYNNASLGVIFGNTYKSVACENKDESCTKKLRSKKNKSNKKGTSLGPDLI